MMRRHDAGPIPPILENGFAEGAEAICFSAKIRFGCVYSIR